MVALMGDAELDEGNIYECLIEAYKHDIRNCWWIVDYNRQSLDATTAERMFRRFDEIFASCGWRVVTLKYGKRARGGVRRRRGGAEGLARGGLPTPIMRRSPISAARPGARGSKRDPGRRTPHSSRRMTTTRCTR